MHTWLAIVILICLLSFHLGRIIISGIAFNIFDAKSLLTPTDLGGLIVSTVWSGTWVIMLCVYVICLCCDCSSKPMFTDFMNCFPNYRTPTGLLITEFLWTMLLCVPDMIATVLFMVSYHAELWMVIVHGVTLLPAVVGFCSALITITLIVYVWCYHCIFGTFPTCLFPHLAQNAPTNVFIGEIPRSTPMSMSAA
jgi:hypothetical protein